MSSNNESIKNWVSDKIFDILGYRESTMVDYIIALSKKAKDVNSFISTLTEQDFPINSNTKSFAQELLNKSQQKIQNITSSSSSSSSTSLSSSSSSKDKEKEKIEFLKKNKSYKLVIDHDDDIVNSSGSSDSDSDSERKRKKKEKKKEKKDKKDKKDKKSSTRKKSDNNWDDEIEPEPIKPNEKEDENNNNENNDNNNDNNNLQKRQPYKSIIEEENNNDNNNNNGEEDEYEREQREVKELSDRIKKRDEKSTKKKIVDDSETKESIERKNRLEQNEQLETERTKSRRKYLVGEEQKRLILLKREIEEEYELFKDQKLTEQEIKDFEKKKKLYELASQRINESQQSDDYYQLPSEIKDKDSLLKSSYINDNKNKKGNDSSSSSSYNPEQKEWEQNRMKSAISENRGLSTANIGGGNEEYEYVFEDQIEFIKEEVLKQGQKGDGVMILKPGDDGSAQAKMTIQEVRKSLPVYPYREQLIDAVREYQVLIIVGETGSGKTTQIPQYLHEAGFSKTGKIGCTQPRRVAAMSVAARVAEEVGCKLGNEVGYSIRFEDCTSQKTVLQYMTDGMLVREFLTAPDLASYSVLIIDEAHERTLHTDILFGLLKDITRFRPDLKLLISSATMDAERFSDYFDGAPTFNIPGRKYEVTTHYTQAPEADYLDAAVVTVLQIHITEPLGDILVFLTGQEEVDQAAEMLQTRTRGLGTKIKELIITRIYSTLPTDLQAKIFEPTPPNARKVVLATNIAETSLTIDGIIYVIDPGFCKQKMFNPRTGMESLVITPVSRASANQRKGRAGRVAPGKCFRLFTAWAFDNELEENTIPEIQRTNLGNVVLLLKSMGINDLMNFDFMDPPPAQTLIAALEQLYALGALNDRGQLTKLGRKMAEFPVDPQLSKMIIASEKYKCSEEILTICAMLSVGNTIFYRPKDKAFAADAARKLFFHPQGDHLTLMNVFNQWRESGYAVQWCFENFIQHRSMKRAQDVRDQLELLLERVEIPLVSNVDDTDSIRKCIASGFFYNSAKLEKSGLFRTTKHNQSVQIHPSSCLFQSPPKWVVYHELVLTTKEFMRQIVEIQSSWLHEIAPHIYKEKDVNDNQKLPKNIGKKQINK
ncbi:DEAD/DEAH box helicase [Dictyostelium discoideum AX4]|uniref:Putative pre-mRNA-splicing factor ATP-dependent RNA helicase DHX16 n=1 Tax=Dictyostelium discoideum TaxID=44689 RepID=DHX16_DICDI|nr:DEAD/DEAH box helicase [Dictyostelium discoideum AX4]Q54MH3.1 RecName: Full=Putative pre-mRNA-splicing factor ATP-dependent RNA helicase DHX16; AltName: Full=DEAH-box protein 16 [Dictyostelium discoideum]EAL64503.1 DEAD/DEAH box helicase [Dictyostelium discoideum AX4]|eukprot:XP_638017.1 DEAD/DEAH box helicase [Dictyostelium discoideum AX4]